MNELNKALADINTGGLIQSPVEVSRQAMQKLREMRQEDSTLTPEEYNNWKSLLEHLVEEEGIDGIEDLLNNDLPAITVDEPLPDLDEESLPDIDFK